MRLRNVQQGSERSDSVNAGEPGQSGRDEQHEERETKAAPGIRNSIHLILLYSVLEIP